MTTSTFREYTCSNFSSGEFGGRAIDAPGGSPVVASALA
jgi:hypothetical protein